MKTLGNKMKISSISRKEQQIEKAQKVVKLISEERLTIKEASKQIGMSHSWTQKVIQGKIYRAHSGYENMPPFRNKFTDSQVIHIFYAYWYTKKTLAEIAKSYNVSAFPIRQIKDRETHKNITTLLPLDDTKISISKRTGFRHSKEIVQGVYVAVVNGDQTQAVVSEKTGISQSDISKIINGRLKPEWIEELLDNWDTNPISLDMVLLSIDTSSE